MRPLRYSINVTLDGCCDHRVGIADAELHRHAAENIAHADALLFGRVTYEMMESAWRIRDGVVPEWMDDWMIPFARTIDAAKKYVVSSTLNQVNWNAELVQGDLGEAVERLKLQPGNELFTGGVDAAPSARRVGIDRRVRIHRTPSDRRARADVVRWVIEDRRFEARGSKGVCVGCGGVEIRA
jgi:dihydrofolate reductase